MWLSANKIKHLLCFCFVLYKQFRFIHLQKGDWTIDKLESILTDTYVDNGNTIRDAGDRYGLTFGDLNKYYGMTAGLGMQAFTKDETGYEFILDNERNVTAFQRPVEFINGNENVLASK